jgi:hypothetical protein
MNSLKNSTRLLSSNMPTKEEIRNFSLMLREYAAHHQLGLWDALVHFCETKEMESEVAASLLSKEVLGDLTIEAQDKNLLKRRGRRGGRLPI